MARWKLILATGLVAVLLVPTVSAQATEGETPEVTAPDTTAPEAAAPAVLATAEDWSVTLICPSGSSLDCTPSWGPQGKNTLAQYRMVIDNYTKSRIYLCGRVKMFINKEFKGMMKFEQLEIPANASDFVLPTNGSYSQQAKPVTAYKASNQHFLRKNGWIQGPDCHA